LFCPDTALDGNDETINLFNEKPREEDSNDDGDIEYDENVTEVENYFL